MTRHQPTRQARQDKTEPHSKPETEPMSKPDIALRYEVCKNMLNPHGVCVWIHVGRRKNKDPQTGTETLTVSERCHYCDRFKLTHYESAQLIRYMDHDNDTLIDAISGKIIS